MPSPENGMYIVMGEMSVVVTAMRRGTRWSSHTNQDEEQDSLLRNFTNLREILNHVNHLDDIEPTTFLAPFLDVIRSQDTTGPVTGFALSSVNKFLSYDLIGHKSENAPTAVENIADAVTHARFVGTDPASDEVVLMKILQVLRTLLLTQPGTLLTNDSVCEIMQSCFRICFEIRLSELLRKSAEHAVVDMVQLLFCRLPTFSEDLKYISFRKFKMKAGGMETGKSSRKKRSPRTKHKKMVDSSKTDVPIIPTPPPSIVASPDDSIRDSDQIEISVPLSNDAGLEQSENSREPSEVRTVELDSSTNTEQPESVSLHLALTDNFTSNETQLETPSSLTSLTELNERDQGDENPSLEKRWDGIYGSQEFGSSLTVDEVDPTTVSVGDLSSLSSEKEGDYINPRGVRFTAQQLPKEGVGPLVPYGLPCVRELFRFLVTLINPLDSQNNEVMMQIGLSLLTVALESGADSIGNYNCLMVLVKDELCRNLFSLLNSDRMAIFGAAQRVCFLLFESLRTHLKFQLETYMTKLMDIIISEAPRISYEHREIALDSIVQLWCIPGLVTELYLNYDCDLYCSNLFEDLTKLLSKNAFPVSGLFNTHLLSLDALLTVVDSIEAHCHYRILSESQIGKDDEEKVIDEKGNANDIKDVDDNKPVLTLAASGFIMNANLSIQEPEVNNSNGKGDKKVPQIKPNRMKVSNSLPTHEEIMAIKHKKKLLATGTEHFNSKPVKGIAFLQEHGLLKDPLDAQEVGSFLRDNPRLEKKMIGEYISNRKNLKVLEAFVNSFSFDDTRIDEALRMYLESFRLPGEAPLISLLLEHFAEHWHKSNGEPFANSDAAFTLAYAVIMLNVDQHNHNVKRQNIPMTIEEFKKNLKKVNGNKDFEEEMLEEIYISIKGEEIVMPAEQVGLVKENYLWKVLLRRGSSKEGQFSHAPNGLFDHDLFSLSWGPTVAALSYVFDKTSDGLIIQKSIAGFRKCAMISAHYGMSDVFDYLVISLCKYTALSASEVQENLPVAFGSNSKAQLAASTVFNLAHRHGDILREGWKNLLDCVLQLFKAKLLPKVMVEAEDFIAPNGVVSLIREDIPVMPRIESGLLSSFYSYITLTSDSQVTKSPTVEEEAMKEAATICILDCHPEQLITESKFLRIDSLQEMMKALIYQSQGPDSTNSLSGTFDEDSTVFMLELLVSLVLQNRDRINFIWPAVQDHLYSLMMTAANKDFFYLLERAVIGLLRICIRMMRKEEMGAQVLQSLRMLLHLKASILHQVSRQVSFAIYELLRTSAANIHASSDWITIFTLIESVGAGAKPPESYCIQQVSNNAIDDTASDPGAQSDSELSVGRNTLDSGQGSDRGYTSDGELYEASNTSPSHQPTRFHRGHRGSLDSVSSNSGWILVGKEGDIEGIQFKPLPVNQFNIILELELQAHDPCSFVKCCESLAFLVRDVAHITPHNFESCVHCIRTFVEASLDGGFNVNNKNLKASKELKEKKSPRLATKKRDNQTRATNRQSRMSPSHNFQGYEADDEDRMEKLPSGYQEGSIQLLDLMHTLHTRASSIFKSWASEDEDIQKGQNLWANCWCPLLQGIARLCCDKRRNVRTSALTYLQRALLVHDLQALSAMEWEACFNQVLFPLLAKLLEPINFQDPSGMEETRVRGATLLCKVFLQHLNPLLTLSTFTALWLTILDFMDKYMHAEKGDLLKEAIPELLKNMLLVMETAGIIHHPDDGASVEDQQLWHITWDRIDSFLPKLKDELFKPVSNSQQPEIVSKIDVVSPTLPNVAAATPEPILQSSGGDYVLQMPYEDASQPEVPDKVNSPPQRPSSPLPPIVSSYQHLPVSLSSVNSSPGNPITSTSVTGSPSVILHPPMAPQGTGMVPSWQYQQRSPGSVPLFIDPSIVRPNSPVPIFTQIPPVTGPRPTGPR